METSSQFGYIQGKIINNQFFIYGSECEKYIYLAIWCVCWGVLGGGGGGGASMIRLGLLCFLAILLPDKSLIYKTSAPHRF